ncbi:hypothetical protein AK812_SmicGene23634 [Symbiodinium microadriaticum]|uniref:Uncharacterized protein n=1 Tax=Symbiodinium microadriaticum TaxID=2951 RepID=A0A1Q9DGP0_SYMMI|nr:hypothetical protein AK812_SmicGene23634 [Symbiodinium microadriaticum]
MWAWSRWRLWMGPALFLALSVPEANAAWGTTIDVAGRQRMLTQRMSKEFLLVSLGLDPEGNKARMMGSINLFNVSLNALINGNPDLNIFGAPSDLVRTSFQGVVDLWVPFAQLLISNVDTVRDAFGNVDAAVLDAVAAGNVPLLVQSNVCVGRLVDAAKSAGAQTNGLVVDTAGRQRMLIQRMCKESFLIASGVSVSTNVALLKSNDYWHHCRSETSRVAGYGLLQRELSEKEKADQDLVIRLLQRHKLSALNTWSKKGTAATYLHAKGRSQIDYVCARQAVSDGEAKKTKPAVTEMAGWRTTGHHPLVGSIPHRWTPWAKQHREGRTEPKAGPDLTKLGSWTNETHPCGVKELREAVLRAGGETPERLVRPELAPVTDEIKGCWKLRRRLQIVQTLLGAGMVFVFKYFRLRLDYMRAHRLLKQTLRARKRSRTLALLQQAEAAASRHNMRGLFGVINMLCPRKGVQRIRLRDDEGNLMNGLEECKVLAAYARELFMAANSPRLPLLRIPAEILEQHSTRIVPILHAQAVHHLCRDTPQIPGEWTEVQLAWLAKPGKCPSKPSNLRTVGLMAGDTKMFMTVLKEAVQAEITKGLWDIPQFAYRKLASTTDALLRGSLHCIHVRALAGQVNTDAFDCMPFGVMYESLREVNFDKSMAVLLLRGSAASGIKKRFVKWDRLPVHDRMEYLGATLSYGAMEMQTVQSRATKAWANYTKLRFYDVQILHLPTCYINYYKVLQDEQKAPPQPPTGSSTLEAKDIAEYQTRCILCAQMVKVLAVRKLYSDGTLALHLHSRRGPALKQHEKEKQYVKVERTGIQAMLCGQASKSEPDEVTTNQQETPQTSDQSSELLVKAAQGDAPGSSSYICPDRSSGSTTTGTRSVRLHNPHNLCYMNAGILALVHALQDTALPRGLRQIQDAINGPQGSGLNLAAHFGLRSLFRGWTLDNRQKDAAEFTGFLLNKVGFGQMSWESRVMGRGVHQVMDAGTGMLYLDLPHGDCDLQELVSAWSYQAHTHAIVIATDCFIVQLGRFPHRGKSMIQVRFAQEVNVPVFTTGIDCEWRPYFVVAGLLHFGDSPNSGHYRAVLREQDDWWLTDDGAIMAGELEVPMEQEEELRIWAAFKQAAPQTAESLALEVDRSAKFHKPEGKGDSKGPDAKMTDEKDAETNPGSTPGSGQGSRGRASNGQGSQGSKGYGQQGGYQRSRNQNSWNSGRWSSWKKDDEDEAIAALKLLVGQLARLCLRHEDSINMWRAESSFVLFVRTGIPGSLVPSLFAAKTEWQKLKEEQPEKVKRPMRNMLFSCLLREMFDRLQLLRGDAERRGSMEKLGWLKGEDFQRLRWDSKLKKNVKDEESSVISYEDVMTILQSMLTRCNTVEALLRFHPTRPITEQMQEGTVAFLLQFSLQHNDGLQLYADMTQLCHCGSTMVCGIEVKKERSSRSQLANQISTVAVISNTFHLASSDWGMELRLIKVMDQCAETSSCLSCVPWDRPLLPVSPLQVLHRYMYSTGLLAITASAAAEARLPMIFQSLEGLNLNNHTDNRLASLSVTPAILPCQPIMPRAQDRSLRSPWPNSRNSPAYQFNRGQPWLSPKPDTCLFNVFGESFELQALKEKIAKGQMPHCLYKDPAAVDQQPLNRQEMWAAMQYKPIYRTAGRWTYWDLLPDDIRQPPPQFCNEIEDAPKQPPDSWADATRQEEDLSAADPATVYTPRPGQDLDIASFRALDQPGSPPTVVAESDDWWYTMYAAYSTDWARQGRYEVAYAYQLWRPTPPWSVNSIKRLATKVLCTSTKVVPENNRKEACRALDSLWVLPFLRAVQSAWLATESAMGMSVIPDFILPVLTNLGGLSRPSSTYAQPMAYSQSLAAMRHFLTIPWQDSTKPIPVTPPESRAFTLRSLKVCLLAAGAQVRATEEARQHQGHHKSPSVQLYSRDDTILALDLQGEVSSFGEGVSRFVCSGEADLESAALPQVPEVSQEPQPSHRPEFTTSQIPEDDTEALLVEKFANQEAAQELIDDFKTNYPGELLDEELLAADRKIWGTIGSLVSGGWSLDEALYEVPWREGWRLTLRSVWSFGEEEAAYSRLVYRCKCLYEQGQEEVAAQSHHEGAARERCNLQEQTYPAQSGMPVRAGRRAAAESTAVLACSVLELQRIDAAVV